ncbi:hypothetical protein ABZP36_005180 [Zizania latifolia]
MDGYPLDQIWIEIEAPDVLSGPNFDEGKDNADNSLSAPLLPSPVWDYYCAETRWRVDEDIKFLAVMVSEAEQVLNDVLKSISELKELLAFFY